MFLWDCLRCGGARSCSYGTVHGVVAQGHVLTGLFKVWWGVSLCWTEKPQWLHLAGTAAGSFFR